MQKLVDQLNQLCDEQPFTTNWSLMSWASGDKADRDGDVVLYSASTRKIWVMMALMDQIHQGKLSLDDPFVIEEKYQNTHSGCFAYLKPGFEVTLYDAIVMMIIVSDNVCTGKIVDMLGPDLLNEYFQKIGMNDTVVRQNIPSGSLWKTPDQFVKVSNTTTANDARHVLNLMVQGSQDEEVAAKLGCSSELCKLALQIMSWQKIGRLNQMLPITSYIPTSAKVAHKTGSGPSHAHDCGVIYKDDEPLFTLTVYTHDWPVDLPSGVSGKFAAVSHVARLSRTCWDYFAGS